MTDINSSIDRFDQLFKDKGARSQRSYPNESLIQFIASNWFALELEQRKEVRILEVGCGSGANLWMLAKEGFSVYGLDSSQRGLDLAKHQLAEKWGVTANLKHGSATELPYDTGFFDAVIDIVTLQHLNLTNSAIALAEISRVLRKGGLFFSYRLSDRSTMFLNSGGTFIDSVTVDNITDTAMPLNNNGPTSFWSAGLVKKMYSEQDITVDAIEHLGRTYGNGRTLVEYLAVTARKLSCAIL